MSLILKILTSWNCNFLDSVSLQQKFEVTDRLMLQLSFVWQAKEKTSSRYKGSQTQKKRRREARGPILAPLFIHFFLLPLSLTYVNWASQEGCLFYLRFSLWSLDFPLFYFSWAFPLLCLLATSILDAFFLFELPNRTNQPLYAMI